MGRHVPPSLGSSLNGLDHRCARAQTLVNQIPDTGFVVDDEDSSPFQAAASSASRFSCFNGFALYRWQQDTEAGPAGRRHLRFDRSAMLFDDHQTNRQTQARATACAVSSKEGIEYLRTNVGRDPRPIVIYENLLLATRELDMNGHVAMIAHRSDRFLRVCQQVDENLGHVLWVCFNGRQVWRGMRFDSYVPGFRFRLLHFNRAIYQFSHVDLPTLMLRWAGEHEQSLHQLRRFACLFVNQSKLPM